MASTTAAVINAVASFTECVINCAGFAVALPKADDKIGLFAMTFIAGLLLHKIK